MAGGIGLTASPLNVLHLLNLPQNLSMSSLSIVEDVERVVGEVKWNLV